MPAWQAWHPAPQGQPPPFVVSEQKVQNKNSVVVFSFGPRRLLAPRRRRVAKS